MPSKSESQKRLFCMAYAVRKGKLARNKVNKAVLDIADGDMTDKEIKEFMVKECKTLTEYLRESLYNTPYAKFEDTDEESIEFPEGKHIFVVLKPGFLKLSEQIINKFKEHKYELVATRTKQLLEKEAKALYAVHKKESFFDDLVKYMSSDLSTGMLFKPMNKKKMKTVFNEVSKLKDEIRKEWGESDMRNVLHSSDNLEDMKNEESVYFYTNPTEKK